MKKNISLFTFVFVLLCFSNIVMAQQKPIKSFQDSVSYAFGYIIGKQMLELGDVNKDILIKAINDQHGTAQLMDEKMAKSLLAKSRQKKDQAARELAAKQAVENKKLQEEFLTKNAREKGVGTTPSGLQYKILKEGKGTRPNATDEVKVHYEGRLLDGTVFDSSIKRGEPAVFPLNRVIKGWTEGVQLMQIGSKYQFFIPAELAYGERVQKNIPPNSLLIFDVELLAIRVPEPTASKTPQAPNATTNPTVKSKGGGE
ncbi:MAG: FKBP-type peptidyl-prolyl cis-trans isomerase [Bacteroidota bacterium]